jgi:hypothetical protein
VVPVAWADAKSQDTSNTTAATVAGGLVSSTETSNREGIPSQKPPWHRSLHWRRRRGEGEELRGIAVELNDVALGISESERELELATEIERGDRRNCRRDAKRIRKACTDFEEANA